MTLLKFNSVKAHQRLLSSTGHWRREAEDGLLGQCGNTHDPLLGWLLELIKHGPFCLGNARILIRQRLSSMGH